MSEPKVQYRPDTALGTYLVFLDGEEVGRVRKKVTHYNLARPVTVTEWLAYRKSGMKVGSSTTRKGATEILLACLPKEKR